MKTITPRDMRLLEARVFEKTTITSLDLQERAAQGLCHAALEYPAQKALFVCGRGNNGADGIAAARLFRQAGREAVVWRLSGALTEENKVQERLWGDTVVRYEEGLALPTGTGLIVDALFGTGLSRPLSGEAKSAAMWIGGLGLPVLCADTPSGLDGQTGQPLGACVRATETVTFHRVKQGLLLGEGPDYAGKLTVWDIGIPSELDNFSGYSVLTPNDVMRRLKPRQRISHKGDYGRVMILAGSVGMAGAAGIAALAAFKTGAGLVSVACPREIVGTVTAICPPATCTMLDSEQAFTQALARAQVLAAGCGLGTGEEAKSWLSLLLRHVEKTDKPCVLDADALNLIAMMPDPPKFTKNQLMTPHPAEAARLLGWDAEKVLTDPTKAAQRLVERYGCAALVKGAVTVMAAQSGMALNTIGTPAMAKAGSGDALTGTIAAVLAQKLGADTLDAMQLGCGLHGLAGRRAAARQGENGLLATELCTWLGRLSCESRRMLGSTVTVTVDRPLGSAHPRKPKILYPVNYGYVAGVPADDGAWQDAYVLGIDTPVRSYTGRVVAVVHRLDDTEDKWIVAPEGVRLTEKEIWEKIKFIEQFFLGKIEMEE